MSREIRVRLVSIILARIPALAVPWSAVKSSMLARARLALSRRTRYLARKQGRWGLSGPALFQKPHVRLAFAGNCGFPAKTDLAHWPTECSFSKLVTWNP